jgi:hypothetical protein
VLDIINYVHPAQLMLLLFIHLLLLLLLLLSPLPSIYTPRCTRTTTLDYL